jgi:ribonuclease HI
MKIQVFTDGACSSNGKAEARASYAFWIPDHKELSRADRVPDSEPQTNNRGELMGIYEAVKCVYNNFPANEIELQIFTDSMYSKNCLTIWLPGFIERNWKTSGYKGSAGGNDVKNRDIIEETVKLLPKFKSYIISYVPAHTGKNDDLSKNNDIVDRMAVAVLNPEVAEMKIIHTNTEVAIEGLPVEMMGPPVSPGVLVRWCRNNLDKLDEESLDTALLTVLTKTLKKNGFSLEKQKQHRNTLYRLVANNLIAEGTKVIKEDE